MSVQSSALDAHLLLVKSAYHYQILIRHDFIHLENPGRLELRVAIIYEIGKPDRNVGARLSNPNNLRGFDWRLLEPLRLLFKAVDAQ
jgi:hypothetical protein